MRGKTNLNKGKNHLLSKRRSGKKKGIEGASEWDKKYRSREGKLVICFWRVRKKE